MRDKLNQFVANLNGQFVEVSDSTNINQCMDLAYNWIFTLGFPKATIQNLNASQVYTNPKEITYQYFDVIPNTTDGIPQDGDLVVWKTNHIAIALGGGTIAKFKCFEQNAPIGTHAHISEKSYTNVLGWLRPKIHETAPAEPNWFKTLLQESGLSLEREGQFREFWEKAKKYNDDIRALQEQVKSANEALADRALEVSTLTEKNQKLSDAATEAQEQLNKARSDYATAVAEKQTIQYQFEKLTIKAEENQKAITSISEQLEALRIDYAALEKTKIKDWTLLRFLKAKYWR